MLPERQVIDHLVAAARVPRSDAVNVDETCSTPVVHLAKTRNKGCIRSFAEIANGLSGKVARLPDFWRQDVLNLL